MSFEDWLIEKKIDYWYVDGKIYVEDEDLAPFIKELRIKFPELEIDFIDFQSDN